MTTLMKKIKVYYHRALETE